MPVLKVNLNGPRTLFCSSTLVEPYMPHICETIDLISSPTKGTNENGKKKKKNKHEGKRKCPLPLCRPPPSESDQGFSGARQPSFLSSSRLPPVLRPSPALLPGVVPPPHLELAVVWPTFLSFPASFLTLKISLKAVDILREQSKETDMPSATWASIAHIFFAGRFFTL